MLKDRISAYQGQPFSDLRAERLFKQAFELHLVGNVDEAVQMYKSAIAMEPHAKVYTYLAWALSSRHEYEQAVRLCHRAIEIDPDYPNPYNDMGAYLIELGRDEEAMDMLNKALSFSDYECPFYAHYNLGRIYKKRGHLLTAQRCFSRALNIKNDFGAAWKEYNETMRLVN